MYHHDHHQYQVFNLCDGKVINLPNSLWLSCGHPGIAVGAARGKEQTILIFIVYHRDHHQYQVFNLCDGKVINLPNSLWLSCGHPGIAVGAAKGKEQTILIFIVYHRDHHQYQVFNLCDGKVINLPNSLWLSCGHPGIAVGAAR